MGKYKFMVAAENATCFNAATDKEYDIKGEGVPESLEVDNYIAFTAEDFINDNADQLYAGHIPLSDMKKVVGLFMEYGEFRDYMIKKSLEVATKETDGRNRTIMKLALETWKELCSEGWYGYD